MSRVRSKRLCASKALEFFQSIPEYQSEEEGPVDSLVDTGDLFDISSDESGDDFSSTDDNEGTVSSSIDDFVSKNGTTWKKMSPNVELTVRTSVQNIFTGKPGPTSPAVRSILAESKSSALKLMIDEKMLRHIHKCTVIEGKRVLEKWDMSMRELEQFIGLLFARGVLGMSNTPVEQIWSQMWGVSLFKKTMSRNRFQEIQRFLRFDMRSERSTRLEQDKFGLISQIWNDFTDNCSMYYNPKMEVTIDEQLFPTKTRCPFTQYISNKPDKFGIKFWLLADVESKYCCAARPYLGKDSTRPSNVPLGSFVVTSLLNDAGILGKGYNVTCDNFFTSKSLIDSLIEKKTSLVGTVRNNSRDIPPIKEILLDKSLPIFSTMVFKSKNNCTLTAYKAKKNKSVMVMSSLHPTVSISEKKKKKPETIEYYNHTKFGVDSLDQMCRLYSTKSGTRHGQWLCSTTFWI
eukprot:TRINITY_DN18369_c0_g1_i1.p1 TRINITY_DN18369_c0_g1~~TRINITY_DN18369_c0_g1_i1.p1  ORF type:complete len:460 (+),score=-15.26 TRINITY_DN18369_c0_g1_i1:160-1539(+)